MPRGALQTEFEFTLPQGYTDGDGNLHTDGVMRLATAADELQPLTDPRVQSNASYLTVILLSRVVTRLGELDDVTPHTIENLFVSDLAYLQDLYERVNTRGVNAVTGVCPECGTEHEVHLTLGPNGTSIHGDTGANPPEADLEVDGGNP